MERSVERWRRFWSGAGGGREVLVIAYPLILGHMSFTLQTFVDRLFLTWYSPEAVAGRSRRSSPSGSSSACSWARASTSTTFVAQYLGAGLKERIGPALWQGIYFSAAAGLLVAALVPVRRAPCLRLARPCPRGHGRRDRLRRVLMLGAFPVDPHGDPVHVLRGPRQHEGGPGRERPGHRDQRGPRLPLDLRAAVASRGPGSKARPGRRWCPRWWGRSSISSSS